MTSSASPLLPGIDDITKSVRLNRQLDHDFEEAGFGGTAEVFRGTYRQKNGRTINVAVKCIRPSEFDGREDEYKAKTIKKLVRELEIWRMLRGGANIIELLGMITNMGPLPSAVCPFCTWNLKDVSHLI
ncbi:hypothetical protein FS749_008299 [Ceratobasidium sp. UAMH 11750]|nr:hypothetical protein FS749_008299 [Ceratobasidium sp. UAMH 11750]